MKKENGKIFCVLKNDYLIATPEEVVRQEYINHLINDYGYDANQMEQEVVLTNSSRGNGQAQADIVIWKSKEDKEEKRKAFIVVECKSESVKLRREDYYQGSNYAGWAKAKFFVITNQKETKYFKVNEDYIPDKFEEITGIPKAIEINDEKKIKELLNQTKTFTREEFTKLLFRCHSIIRNNDKLSPEAAFDEISKILFMKISQERDHKGRKIYRKEDFELESKIHEENIRPSLKGTQNDLPYMQFLFLKTKSKYKEDQLFEGNDIIKIRENSFTEILKELEKYNLSDTQDDIKGIAFEEFLGRTFRGELGQFFTPRTVVDFMASVLDLKEEEKICDPTCGSGGFLIKSFEYIKEKIEKDIENWKEKLRKEIETLDYDVLSDNEKMLVNKKIEKMQNILNTELDTGIKGSRMYNLSRNCIYGTDANPRMARTSKMNMIMHGDGHGGVHHHDGLLNINGIYEEKFDVILTNPPFGARVDKSQKVEFSDVNMSEEEKKNCIEKYGVEYNNIYEENKKKIGKKIVDLFSVKSNLTEVLFIERCLNLLKKGGRLGIVLPEGVLNTGNLQKARELFESKAKIILICSLPQDVFMAAGANIKPSLVFLQKFTEEEERDFKFIKDEIEKQYKNEKEKIEKKRKVIKGNKEELKELKKEEEKINELIKLEIKKKFDYEIVMAQIEKAGITSTGGKCENQLNDLLKEFKFYCEENNIWKKSPRTIQYLIEEDKVYRKIGTKLEEIGEI